MYLPRIQMLVDCLMNEKSAGVEFDEFIVFAFHADESDELHAAAHTVQKEVCGSQIAYFYRRQHDDNFIK